MATTSRLTYSKPVQSMKKVSVSVPPGRIADVPKRCDPGSAAVKDSQVEIGAVLDSWKGFQNAFNPYIITERDIIANLTGKVRELEARAKHQDALVMQLEGAINYYRQQDRQSSAKLLAYAQKEAAWENDRAAYVRKISTLEEKLAAANSLVAELSAEVQQAEHLNSLLLEAENDYKVNEEQLLHKLADLEQQIQANHALYIKQVAEVQHQNMLLRQQLHASHQDLQHKHQQLQAVLNAGSSSNSNSNVNEANLKSQVQALQAELAAAQTVLRCATLETNQMTACSSRKAQHMLEKHSATEQLLLGALTELIRLTPLASKQEQVVRACKQLLAAVHGCVNTAGIIAAVNVLDTLPAWCVKEVLQVEVPAA